jgi:hypothetical protein
MTQARAQTGKPWKLRAAFGKKCGIDLGHICVILCQHQYAGRVGEYFGKVTMSVGSAPEIGKFSWNGMVFHVKNVFPASLEPT